MDEVNIWGECLSTQPEITRGLNTLCLSPSPHKHRLGGAMSVTRITLSERVVLLRSGKSWPSTMVCSYLYSAHLRSRKERKRAVIEKLLSAPCAPWAVNVVCRRRCRRQRQDTLAVACQLLGGRNSIETTRRCMPQYERNVVSIVGATDGRHQARDSS